VNASPEPVSNVAVSLGEDTAVVGVLLLAVDHPWLAFAIALVLLVAGVTVATFAIRRIRRGLRRVQARLGPRSP
jgi:heme exporter protein D